jgi:serine/threonine protein kinase
MIFAAPEFFDQPKYSHHSDIDSFGFLLHELLFHLRPFEIVENGQISSWNHDIGRETKAVFEKSGMLLDLQMTISVSENSIMLYLMLYLKGFWTFCITASNDILMTDREACHMFISDSSRCWHQCLPLPTIFILY